MKKIFIASSILFLVSLSVIWGYMFFNSNQATKDVQSSAVTPEAIQSMQASKNTILSSSPTPSIKKHRVTIALFGDSMIDTMGDDLEILHQVLQEQYSEYSFSLYNYGIGAQNVSDGRNRFESPYVYKERNFPPIPELAPDVLIIGTFSYNPLNPHDPQKHKEELKTLLSQAKNVTPLVYLLVEIAPLSWEFGKGERGINWPDDASEEHANKIRDQLRGSLALGNELNITVIDTFTPSQVTDSEGNPQYVSPDDGIHPSYEGHVFTARKISSILELDSLRK